MAAYFFDIYGRGLMDNLQAFVATMVMTLFVPCVANTFVIIKERGLLVGLGIVCFVVVYAIVCGRSPQCRSEVPARDVLRG